MHTERTLRKNLPPYLIQQLGALTSKCSPCRRRPESRPSSSPRRGTDTMRRAQGSRCPDPTHDASKCSTRVIPLLLHHPPETCRDQGDGTPSPTPPPERLWRRHRKRAPARESPRGLHRRPQTSGRWSRVRQSRKVCRERSRLGHNRNRLRFKCLPRKKQGPTT